MIDITGLDKAEVLKALYDNSAPQGLGFLQAEVGGLDINEARHYVTGDSLYFDYLKGRPIKTDLSEDEFDPFGFDRDNGGRGSAERIVAALRSGSVLEDTSDRMAVLKGAEVLDVFGTRTETTMEGGVLKFRLGLDSELESALQESVSSYMEDL